MRLDSVAAVLLMILLWLCTAFFVGAVAAVQFSPLAGILVVVVLTPPAVGLVLWLFRPG